MGEVVPDPAKLALTTYAPEVTVTDWRAIEADGRRRRWVLGIAGPLGAASILVLAAVTSDWPRSLSAAGIVLDIAGASLLATGLMLPRWATTEMATARYGESRSVRAYWEQAATDARLAFFLLLLGFLGQGLGLALPIR